MKLVKRLSEVINTLRCMDAHEKAMAAEHATYQEIWGQDPRLTPRQAYGIAAGLNWFADAELQNWLDEPSSQPLHTVPPCDQIDLRAMILVGENRAWAALAAERCYAVADSFREGRVSFFNQQEVPCYFDELVVAIAVPWAQTQMKDMPEFFEGIPSRLTGPDGAEDWQLDDANGWANLVDVFDDEAARVDWADALSPDLTSMKYLLEENHPFTWFDVP